MDDETEALSPTPRADCLKAAWDNGAVSLQGRGSDGLAIVESLVSDGMLSYSEKLFTPDESAYLDYMFNDATFSNSQGLRNRYDHAHSPIVDPNSEEFRADYYRMLTLLIAVTLKINDELSATRVAGTSKTLWTGLITTKAFSILSKSWPREKSRCVVASPRNGGGNHLSGGVRRMHVREEPFPRPCSMAVGRELSPTNKSAGIILEEIASFCRCVQHRFTCVA